MPNLMNKAAMVSEIWRFKEQKRNIEKIALWLLFNLTVVEYMMPEWILVSYK